MHTLSPKKGNRLEGTFESTQTINRADSTKKGNFKVFAHRPSGMLHNTANSINTT